MISDQMKRCSSRLNWSGSSKRPRGVWPVVVLLAASLFGFGQSVCAQEDLVAIGQRIYRDGVLPSGASLVGKRFDGNVEVSGRDAACMKCHRRSGMGAVEGEIVVAPITGNYLFQPPDKTLLANMDPRRGKGFNLSHPAYDMTTLGRAIRGGVNANGLMMHDMMPRYELDEQSLQALAAYLRQLTIETSPGVGRDTIRMATIVAPGIDPERRKVFIDMVSAAVTGKNASTAVGAQAAGRRHMTSAAEMVLGTERKWALDVWELEGDPATWDEQLKNYYAKAPVFAVMSGLTPGPWQPVHDFCERQKLPCWFPVVDLPPERPADFYSVYFSRGVLLEAEVMARYWRTRAGLQPSRIVQVFVDDDAGRAAATRLSAALDGSGLEVKGQAWRYGDTAGLRRILEQVQESDEVMLWMPPGGKAVMGDVAPPAARRVFLSGQLAGGEHGIPASWKPRTLLVYPFELPQRRDLNLSYFRQWLRLKHIPMVDELLQARLYFAMTYMTDTLSEMLENLYRDYLLERAENMLSRREGSRAQDEDQARQAMRRRGLAILASRRAAGETGGENAEPQTLGLRASTTVFPRLELAPGQRFASKGAYVVRFADAHSDTIMLEADWIVP